MGLLFGFQRPSRLVLPAACVLRLLLRPASSSTAGLNHLFEAAFSVKLLFSSELRGFSSLSSPPPVLRGLPSKGSGFYFSAAFPVNLAVSGFILLSPARLLPSGGARLLPPPRWVSTAFVDPRIPAVSPPSVSLGWGAASTTAASCVNREVDPSISPFHRGSLRQGAGTSSGRVSTSTASSAFRQILLIGPGDHLSEAGPRMGTAS